MRTEKKGKEKLTLEAIAEYPIVTYHEGFTGRARIDEAFNGAGLQPDIALSALDADVIKSYVELGLGIGIVASLAFCERFCRSCRGSAASNLLEARAVLRR